MAIGEGEKLIRANPDEARYVLAQAEMYANNNRLDDALRVARQALGSVSHTHRTLPTICSL